MGSGWGRLLLALSVLLTLLPLVLAGTLRGSTDLTYHNDSNAQLFYLNAANGDATIVGVLNASGLRVGATDVCQSTGTNCPSTLAGANLTGTGTSGTIAKFTGTGSLGNSILAESGSTLAINGNISMPTSFWIGDAALANAANTVALGGSAQATASGATALGYNARATGTQAVAIGNALANTTGSNSIGTSSRATGTNSNAFGANAKATGLQTLAVGEAAVATNDYAIAIGTDANASGQWSVALGKEAHMAANYGTAIGGAGTASASYAIAIGFSANASHERSVALGPYAATTSANQLMIGNASNHQLNTIIHGSLRANSSAPTGSLVIGNDTSTHVIVNGTTGNVGIGTRTPTATLSVDGTINTTGRIYENNSRVATIRVIACAGDSVVNVSCPVTGLSAGERITVWAKGDVFVDALHTPLVIRLAQNITAVDSATLSIDAGDTGEDHNFALLYFNESTSSGSITYNLTTDSGTALLRNVKMVVHVMNARE